MSDIIRNAVLFRRIQTHARNYKRSLATAIEHRDSLILALRQYGAMSESDLGTIGENDSQTQETIRIALDDADRINRDA